MLPPRLVVPAKGGAHCRPAAALLAALGGGVRKSKKGGEGRLLPHSLISAS